MKNTLIVVPFRQMEPYYRRELEKRGLEIEIITVVREQDRDYRKSILERVAEQVAAGKEIVVTRGTLASEVRRRFPQVQVVELEVTDLDVLETMQKYAGSQKRIAVVECASFVEKVQRVGRILGLSVEEYRAEDVSELRRRILQAAGAGVQVIISGGWGEYDGLHLRLLKPYPVVYEMVGCSQEAVSASVERALGVCRAIQSEKQQKEMLRTIINVSPDGLIAVDGAGRITLCNARARRLLGLDSLSQGQPISQVVPELNLEATVQSGQEEKNRVVKSRELVVTNIPLRAGREVLGAISTFQKIQDVEESGRRMRSQLAQKGLTAHYTFDDLIGESRCLAQTKKLAQTFCQLDSTILLTGETGTGKEILAQSIHSGSARRRAPFIPVNITSLTSTLAESELFGYEDASFTGAKKGGRAGIFELADCGTVFIDEIGDASLELQAKLLRALEQRSIRRVGGAEEIPIRASVIAATNRDLSAMLRDGNFRKDLFFRLNMFPLATIPLRKRPGDILSLLEHFLTQTLAPELVQTLLGPEIRSFFLRYHWPGNVRELMNAAEYIKLTHEGRPLTPQDLPAYMLAPGDSQDRVFLAQTEYQLLSAVEANRGIGRNRLHALLAQEGVDLGVGKIRALLKSLEERGLVCQESSGCTITEQGRTALR